MIWQDAFLNDDVIDAIQEQFSDRDDITNEIIVEVLHAAAPAMAAVTMALTETAMTAIFCDGDIAKHWADECDCADDEGLEGAATE